MPPIEPTSAVPQSVTQSLQSAGQMGAQREQGQQQAFQAAEKAKIDREGIAARANETTQATAMKLIQGEQALLDSRMRSVQEARNFEKLNANKLQIAQLGADESRAGREQRGREHSEELELEKDIANRMQNNEDARIRSDLAIVNGTKDATDAEIATIRELRAEGNRLAMTHSIAKRAVATGEEDVENVIKNTDAEYRKVMHPLRVAHASALPALTSELGMELGAGAYGVPDRGFDQKIVDTTGFLLTGIGRAVDDFVNPYSDQAAIQQVVRISKGRAGSAWAGGEGAISSRLSNVQPIDIKDFVHRQMATAVINATGIEINKRGHAVELLVQAYGAVGDGANGKQVQKIRDEFFKVTGIDSALLDTMQQSAYSVIKKRSDTFLSPQVPKTFEDMWDSDTMLTLERGTDAEGNPLEPLEISEFNATLMREVYDPEYLKGPGVFSVYGFGLNGMEDFTNDIGTLAEETPKDIRRFMSLMESVHPGAEGAFGGTWDTALDDLEGARDIQKTGLEGLEEFGFEEERGLNEARLDTESAEANARISALEELLRAREGNR